MWDPPSFEHHPLALNQGGDMITDFPPKHSIFGMTRQKPTDRQHVMFSLIRVRLNHIRMAAHASMSKALNLCLLDHKKHWGFGLNLIIMWFGMLAQVSAYKNGFPRYQKILQEERVK